MLPAIANVSNISFSWSAPDLRINWTGTGDSYQVRYAKNSDGIWLATVTDTDDTGITITGLTAGISYMFEIITIVTGSSRVSTDSGQSQPDYYGYTIPQGLTPPTDCHLVSSSATQADIAWTGDPAADYIISIIDDTGVPQYMTVTGPAATITGLDPNSNYQFIPAITLNEEVLAGDCYIDKPKECC